MGISSYKEILELMWANLVEREHVYLNRVVNTLVGIHSEGTCKTYRIKLAVDGAIGKRRDRVAERCYFKVRVR